MTGSPIDNINALPRDQLESALRQCCASARWVETVAAARPYADADALLDAADAAFGLFGETDWLDAFAPAAQRELHGGDAGTQEATRVALRLYQERFGYPFIIGSEQLAADELLMRVRIRLGLEADAQLRATCYEQTRLTRARLQQFIDRMSA